MDRPHREPDVDTAAELARTVALLHEETARRRHAEDEMARALAEVEVRETALRDAEQLAQLGSWSWVVGSEEVSWSAQVHRIFGTEPSGRSTEYQSYVDMLHPDDSERLLAVIRAAVESGAPYQVDHRIVRADGEVREIRGRGQVDLDPGGAPIRINGSLQDLTEALSAERELQRSRDLFAGVLDAATEQSIIATDPNGLITVFNTGAARMLGYPASEMIGTSPERLHDPSEIRARAAELGIEPSFEVFLSRAAAGHPETRQWTYVTRDGRRLQASITVTAMHGQGGEVSGYIKVGTDITELIEAQRELRASEARFRDTFDHAPNGMMLISVGVEDSGRILQANSAMSELTGYTHDDLLRMKVADLTADEDLDAHEQRFAALREGREVVLAVERHWIHATGRDLWVQFNVSPRTISRDSYVVGQVEDITSRRDAESHLTQMALHDGLTGLPNRVLLMDRIEHAVQASRRSRSRAVVFYVDLDGFKMINDTAGHAAGDETLIQIAAQLRHALRPGDTVARLGGDEFVVVCESLDSDAAVEDIADRILDAVRGEYTFGAHAFGLSASIGAAISDDGSTPEVLLLEADHAMYRAKRSGKDGLSISSGAGEGLDGTTSGAMRVMRIKGELKTALAEDQLTSYGQPIVDLVSGEVVGVESLLRWHHPVQGLLSPPDFLDAVGKTDLMVAIGTHALHEACRMAASWQRPTSTAAPVVHVDIPGLRNAASDLADEVFDALARHDLRPEQLVLEIPESHLRHLTESQVAGLRQVRERGVRVAIDHLGTGSSSLTCVAELPVDILKIDGSIVAGIETRPASAAIVRGIVAIGGALGLTVIAEGVETSSQVDLLLEHGCHIMQGHLFSPPLPECDVALQLSRTFDSAPRHMDH